MEKRRLIVRGTGFRHTLTYVIKFSAYWFVATVAAVTVSAISTYLLVSDLLSPAAQRALMGRITVITVAIIVAVAALAVFSTTRIAGPFVAFKRAFDDVAGGDLSRRLMLRRTDSHLADVEASFNNMMRSLEDRYGS